MNECFTASLPSDRIINIDRSVIDPVCVVRELGVFFWRRTVDMPQHVSRLARGRASFTCVYNLHVTSHGKTSVSSCAFTSRLLQRRCRASSRLDSAGTSVKGLACASKSAAQPQTTWLRDSCSAPVALAVPIAANIDYTHTHTYYVFWFTRHYRSHACLYLHRGPTYARCQH